MLMKRVYRLFFCLVLVTVALLAMPCSVSANGVPVQIVATVRIEPETLNLASKGEFTAFITLPKGYDVRNIDVGTVICGVGTNVVEWAHATKGMVACNTFIAKFNRQDLVNVPVGDKVTLIVAGKVAGAWFEGSDVVRITNKGADGKQCGRDEDKCKDGDRGEQCRPNEDQGCRLGH